MSVYLSTYNNTVKRELRDFMTGRNKLTPTRVPDMSGNGKIPVKKKSSGGGVLNNKLFLFIFMPLMIVISGVTVFFIIKAITSNNALQVSGNENFVYVLPMAERAAETGDKAGKNPFVATGLAPVVLEGIMYNPDGTSFAILKSASMTYVKTIGDEIGDTGWLLAEISDSTVTVTKEDLTEVLSLAANGLPDAIETLPEA